MVEFIYAATAGEPGGESAKDLLKRINLAVIRNEIALPQSISFKEVKSVLARVFGKGHGGNVPPQLSAVYQTLALWLVNLSKPRTESQRGMAAAILSLPRHLPPV